MNPIKVKYVEEWKENSIIFYTEEDYGYQLLFEKFRKFEVDFKEFLKDEYPHDHLAIEKYEFSLSEYHVKGESLINPISDFFNGYGNDLFNNADKYGWNVLDRLEALKNGNDCLGLIMEGVEDNDKSKNWNI